MLKRIATVALVLTAAACAKVSVGEHVAAQDYSGTPKRMFVVIDLDTSLTGSFPDEFSNALIPGLARCEVTARVAKIQPTDLDKTTGQFKFVSRVDEDTILSITQTKRSLVNGEVRSGTYSLRLYNVAQKRDLWRATMLAGVRNRWMKSRAGVGATFADEVIRAMAADTVVKTCPPFPPT